MTIKHEPGILYFQPEPRCPTHGQMHYQKSHDWWTCPGYDGEGCEYRVTSEETWTPLGTVDEIKWRTDP